MAIKIGTKINAGPDEYKIIGSLKKGGFGETFLAERTKPDRLQVVIKVPLEEILRDEIWSKKFAREARILANISHPNVVKILAYWEFPTGEKALVQELVTGAMELPEYLAANPSAPARPEEGRPDALRESMPRVGELTERLVRAGHVVPGVALNTASLVFQPASTRAR